MTTEPHSADLDGFAYVWEFTVQPERQAEFEEVYGPAGSWAQLFERHPGYRGTQLLQDKANPLRYWTIDCWDSAASQRAFRSSFAADFEALDVHCEALTITERLLGEFRLVTGPKSNAEQESAPR